MFEHYVRTFKSLFNHHPGLRHNFSNSIFPAATFNLGPDTVALGHQDYGNLAFGMCALSSLGPYNPKKGGHLVLFNLKIVIEFPPGSTILIPSATVEHGNTAIQHGESRMSLAQYAAGGLFRWVAYGFQSALSLLSQSGGQARKSEIDGAPGSRWKWGLNFFSKSDELADDRERLFAL